MDYRSLYKIEIVENGWRVRRTSEIKRGKQLGWSVCGWALVWALYIDIYVCSQVVPEPPGRQAALTASQRKGEQHGCTSGLHNPHDCGMSDLRAELLH